MDGPLPPGWQKKFTAVNGEMKPYFVNHLTKKTSWVDPRKEAMDDLLAQRPKPSPKPSPRPQVSSGMELYNKFVNNSAAQSIPMTVVTDMMDELTKEASETEIPAPSPRTKSPAQALQSKPTNLDDYFQASNDREVLEGNAEESSVVGGRTSLAKGPDPDLRKGPNPDHLRATLTKLARGPNLSLRRGPQKDLAKGSIAA